MLHFHPPTINTIFLKRTKKRKEKKILFSFHYDNITGNSGEVSSGSDNGGGSGSESEEEIFNDGYGPDLIGDEEDRKKLEQMTEKEREQEIYERIERRAVLKTRYD